jgi:hypothetical protein
MTDMDDHNPFEGILQYTSAAVISDYLLRIIDGVGTSATTGFLLKQLVDALAGGIVPSEDDLERLIEEAWITLAGPTLDAFKTWLTEAVVRTSTFAEFLERFDVFVDDRYQHHLRECRYHVQIIRDP